MALESETASIDKIDVPAKHGKTLTFVPIFNIE
jgi:hypothetical protein